MNPDMHIREDLSRLENRINVALFGALAVDSFGIWLKDKLHLPTDALLYPARTFGTTEGIGRPDFVACDSAGNTIAWIEVECWTNKEQLERYRTIFQERVVALWGKPGPDCDFSLAAICQYLEATNPVVVTQGQANLWYLAELIKEIDHHRTTGAGIASVGDEMWQSAFVVALRRRLGERLQRYVLGQGDMKPGEIQIGTTDTHDNRGYWIRVYSSRSSQRKSVSVLNRTAGRPEIRCSPKSWLTYYLPGKAKAVATFGELVFLMGGDFELWNRAAQAESNGRPRWHATPVALATAEEHAHEFADVLDQLAAPAAVS